MIEEQTQGDVDFLREIRRLSQQYESRNSNLIPPVVVTRHQIEIMAAELDLCCLSSLHGTSVLDRQNP
jgi:hypothetical protein